MKIPTLLALALLSIIIIVGITLKFYFEQKLIFLTNAPTISNIEQSNLSPSSISISFLTQGPTDAKIIYSPNQTLLTDPKIAIDDRDQKPTSRIFHFMTIPDLKPSTTYYFKIKIDNNSYPDQVLSFTTASGNEAFNSLSAQPLVGTIIDSNLNPVSEALVTLFVENYLPLSSYTNLQGSFVLPFKPLVKKDDLSQILKLPSDKDGKLTVSQGQLKSEVDLQLASGRVLPPIVLGQNLDLRDYTTPANALLKPASASAQILNFDINGDGKINSADVSIVSSNIGKKKLTNPKADINLDGVVDQKDLDLIKQALR